MCLKKSKQTHESNPDANPQNKNKASYSNSPTKKNKLKIIAKRNTITIK